MTLKQALERAREILIAGNVEDAPLNSELLLRHALGIGRVQLYLDLNSELSPDQEENFWQLVNRRLNGEPAAYITRHCEFYGLDFFVDPGVLIPRPESELLVDEALKLARNHHISTIAEIGTGCGAIAISLALNLPHVKIHATDISAPALEVAMFNCQKHSVLDRICLLQGDMLEPLPEPADLIIANLPYVRQSDLPLAGLTNPEPPLALDGGSDGLEKIRRLCCQLRERLLAEAYLLLEIGYGQRITVTAFLSGLFPSARIEVMPDLSGIDRVVSLTLSPVSDSNRTQYESAGI